MSMQVINEDRYVLKKVRDALPVQGSTMPDFKKAFGAKDPIEPVRYLIGKYSTRPGGFPNRSQWIDSTASGSSKRKGNLQLIELKFNQSYKKT